MTPVVQEEVSGCGIAACAALAGIGYEQAKVKANALGIFAEDSALWSGTDHVRRLLRALGVEAAAGEAAFSGWDELPDRALLAIKWRLERGTPFWHWVVFHRRDGSAVVLDSKKSLKNNVRRDFGRIKPKWYIELLGCFPTLSNDGVGTRC
ncbi:hypothetical protein KUV86_18310 [Halomonas sp. DP8Y7-3]|uniref:hypothetical protein n=1 Tax=Halomonas sp. DP8Y7-3 TaxID=2859079 RepID=UPI001C95BD94|nr:hypothetical protein [Halomonas sp. DP8Y7-3]MBY5931059.1 hypothetical protein [Halomonas sp. DP8Y7-3]